MVRGLMQEPDVRLTGWKLTAALGATGLLMTGLPLLPGPSHRGAGSWGNKNRLLS